MMMMTKNRRKMMMMTTDLNSIIFYLKSFKIRLQMNYYQNIYPSISPEHN